MGKLYIPEFNNDHMLDWGPDNSKPKMETHEYSEKMLDFIDRVTSPAGADWLFIFTIYVGMSMGGSGLQAFFRMTGKRYSMPRTVGMSRREYVGPQCDFTVMFRPDILQGFFDWYEEMRKQGIEYFQDFAQLMANGILYKQMLKQKTEEAKLSPVVFKKGDPAYKAVMKLVRERKNKKKRKRKDRLPRLVEI